MTTPLRILTLPLLLAVVVACNNAAAPTPSELTQRDKELQDLQALHKERGEALAAMDVPTLAGELVKDSERGREPYNSSAYQEMSRRRDAGRQLAELLTVADRSSLLGLLVLRQIDPESYDALGSEFRISVLVDALNRSETFNTWGLPHLYWEDGAKAIIEEGAPAEPALSPLLKDLRPAPMWGEDEVIESDIYKYRLADYALALILAIRGDDQPIPVDPADRDRIIAGL